MIRPFTCVCLLLAGGSGLYLYQSKHRVQMLDHQIEAVMHEAELARARTGVLKAEWTLMNDPERLGALAGKFLSLKTTTPGQFTTMADLDARLPAVRAPDPAAAGPTDEDAPADAPKPDAPTLAAAPRPAPPPVAPAPAPAAVAQAKAAPAKPKPVQVAAQSAPLAAPPAPGQTASLLGRPVSYAPPPSYSPPPYSPAPAPRVTPVSTPPAPVAAPPIVGSALGMAYRPAHD